ncbi:MAG: alpha/beta hydrolase [Actinomycetota bacterium]|nr:alpha/beta hydrolase [Actinomycetota bacterium]
MRRRTLLTTAATAGLLTATGLPAHATPPARLPGFRHGYATVGGVRLHYVEGGHGDPVVLLPGWPRTWWEFRKVMPALARQRRVITVDLRGMGASAKPEAGYDKKTMAADIAALVTRLGHRRVDVVGSDIGAMVAFSMAANHPDLVRTVTLLDVAHPEESWYEMTLLPEPGETFHLWWFAFNQVRGLPEQLVAGRARALVDYLCELMLVNPDAVTDRDRAIFAAAYDTPDAIRAGNGWYQAFAQDIADDRGYAPVTPPLLAITNPAQYDYLRDLLPRKAKSAEVVQVDGTGHYVVEERPEDVLRLLAERLPQPS